MESKEKDCTHMRITRNSWCISE